MRRQKSEHQVKFQVSKDGGWAANITNRSANQGEDDPMQQQISNVEMMLRTAETAGRMEEVEILQEGKVSAV